MGIFDNTSLDPANDPTTDVWDSTIAEIKVRGLEVHGSMSKRNVEDGATAVVLKATETKSGRVVAIKIYKEPNRQVAHRNGDTVPMTNFFENERRMLAGLQACPLIPKYYFSVAADDATSGDPIQPFHVMEFVEGQRITKFVSESLRGDKSAIVALFQQVLDAIDTIHQVGYLHRDLSDGNVLVDRQGKVRLIDLAEASPLGEEHTRLITTPGFGTEGVSTPEHQYIRKIQADDVRDACTIGYRMFTGHWKQIGESVAAWRRNLNNAGTPSGIVEIIVRGMKPRDLNLKSDRTIWNSAREVSEAIDRLLKRKQFRKRLARNTIGIAAVALVLLVFGYFAWKRVEQIAYTSELKRLGWQREVLSNAPREARADSRVQKRIDAAKVLEQQAEQSSREGRPSEATTLLSKAVDEITQASRVADNISRLKPLIEPLRKILLENDQWNRDCAAINRRLTQLGKEYQEIQRHVETGDPEQAWALIASLQPELVQLIDDNQQSFEIADLMEQVNAQTVGLDASLRELLAYQQIKSDCTRAAAHYANGKWPEARTELLGAMASTRSFLAKHETEEQRKNRLASNAEMVNAQLAANDSLQKQVEELTEQIAEAKSDYQEVLFQGAQYQKERDTAQTELTQIGEELNTAKSTLATKVGELTLVEAERERLTKLQDENRTKLTDYEQRLKRGSEAWKKLSSELATTQSELKRTKDLLARLSQSPGTNPQAARRQIELAEAEQAIQEFDPASWEAANDRLTAESQRYEGLLVQRKKEIAIGKTDRHLDVKAIDSQLDAQFQVVVSALKKRDEKDREAWETLQTQMEHQRLLRQATVDEGWSETSSKVLEIEGKSHLLSSKQEPYESGRSRLAAGNYDFKDWVAFNSIPEVNFAASLAPLGDQKRGSKFTNSIGMDFVYLPPGEFEMGSPSSESGRKNDETLHKVILTTGFYTATTETTQAAYRRVTGEEPWKEKPGVREGDDYPAVYVGWEDATEKFIIRLNRLERENGSLPNGWEYRLLTEAEWEYAARAGSQTTYCFGDDPSQLGHYAWYRDNAEDYAHRVGTKRANKWGLFDMHGNVGEWTADGYADYTSGAVTNPLVTDGGSYRVYRGGSFFISAKYCRSAFRSGNSPGLRYFILGFRVACVQLASQ